MEPQGPVQGEIVGDLERGLVDVASPRAPCAGGAVRRHQASPCQPIGAPGLPGAFTGS
jgi:hypothetical protein